MGLTEDVAGRTFEKTNSRNETYAASSQ